MRRTWLDDRCWPEFAGCMLELPTAESERKVPLEPVNRMTQLRSAFWILLLESTAAFSQSDEEMLEKVRAPYKVHYLSLPK
jgi:hypothetical protein